MSGKRMEVLVALVVAGAMLAVAAPAGAQAASSHPPMAKKTAAMQQQATVKVKESTPGLAAQATISADSAQKLALAQVQRGWVREAELEMEQNTLVYSYDIKARGKAGIEEVLIDAKTGAVVSKKHESARAEAKEEAADKKAAKPATRKPRVKAMKDSTAKPAMKEKKEMKEMNEKKDSTTKP